jgi:hypothetical protein
VQYIAAQEYMEAGLVRRELLETTHDLFDDDRNEMEFRKSGVYEQIEEEKYWPTPTNNWNVFYKRRWEEVETRRDWPATMKDPGFCYCSDCLERRYGRTRRKNMWLEGLYD